MEPITAAIAAILAANRSKPKLYVKTGCPGVLPSDRVSGSPRHRLRSSRRHRQPAGMQEMVRISGQDCDVLKLIGDGVLAIFRTPDAAACTLRAARAVKRNGAELSARRQREGRPVTAVRLGLHIGEVFYGNIGSNERLDFTVVGPAVYDVSRVVSMCRSVDRDLLASAEFVAVTPGADQAHFASVRRFALRGVRRTQDAPRGEPRPVGLRIILFTGQHTRAWLTSLAIGDYLERNNTL